MDAMCWYDHRHEIAPWEVNAYMGSRYTTLKATLPNGGRLSPAYWVEGPLQDQTDGRRAFGHSVVWALKHRVSFGAVFVLASGVLIWALLPHRLASAPDLVVFNGKVITMDSKRPEAEALAIRGERIIAVGNSQEILALAGPDTEEIDLGGRTVIPGINDAHDHMQVFPVYYDLAFKDAEPTWQDVKDALRVAVTKAPKGTVINGTVGMKILDSSQATRAALDALVPDQPVVLTPWTGHSALLNTAAMRDFGVRGDEPDPMGGRYVHSSDGTFNGWMLDFAAFRLFRQWSDRAPEEVAQEQLKAYYKKALELGITTVQNMAMPVSESHMVALFRNVPPPMRVREIWFGYTDEHGRLTQEEHGQPRHPAPRVTVSGTKWILDGSPVEHASAMRQPYKDRPSTSGDLHFSQSEVEAMLRESLQNKEQLILHAIGDRAIQTIFDAMDRTGGKKVWRDKRVRLEHGDFLLPDLLPRAAELGIILVQNPMHFAFADMLENRYGHEQAHRLQPLRTPLEAGIPIAFGSDGPNNPFENIMEASTHPLNPPEAISRYRALEAYTRGSAYAEFEENEKGILAGGMLADFAVLSDNLLTVSDVDLAKIVSVLTVVGGRIVHKNPQVITIRKAVSLHGAA